MSANLRTTQKGCIGLVQSLPSPHSALDQMYGIMGYFHILALLHLVLLQHLEFQPLRCVVHMEQFPQGMLKSESLDTTAFADGGTWRTNSLHMHGLRI